MHVVFTGPVAEQACYLLGLSQAAVTTWGHREVAGELHVHLHPERGGDTGSA